MTRFRTVASVAALAVLFFAGMSCSQGPGERCEQDSDCDDGLFCNVHMTEPAGGTCIANPVPPTNDGGTAGTSGTGGSGGSGAGGDTGVGGGGGDTGGGGGGGAGGGSDADVPDSAPDQAPTDDGGTDSSADVSAD